MVNEKEMCLMGSFCMKIGGKGWKVEGWNELKSDQVILRLALG